MHLKKQDHSIAADKSFDELVDEVRDDDHKLTAKCMRVMTSALEVGADIDRLVKAIGYSRDFIETISQRMGAAGLWIGKMVDSMGWLDENEDMTL